MNLAHEDFQKAIRISNAIQDYFKINFNKNKVRSTDIYEYLSKCNLIEKDRHNGLLFREFLRKLKQAGVLSLIPQCECISYQSKNYEWHFLRMSDEKLQAMRSKNLGKKADVVHLPKMKEEGIDMLLNIERFKVERLPKRDDCEFTPQQLEIRKNYYRAYEYWSEKEIVIMKHFFLATQNIYKVADLLCRQPHIVREKLEELKVL
jgi:hypothetical protein